MVDDVRVRGRRGGGLKEAFGLPDALRRSGSSGCGNWRPRRARAPLICELAALAAWVGENGRAVDADAQLTPADKAEVLSALGVAPAEVRLPVGVRAGVVAAFEARRGPGPAGRDRRGVGGGDDGSVFSVGLDLRRGLERGHGSAAPRPPS